MCGIVGFLTNQDFGPMEASLMRATSTLRHRGPDDAGHFFDRNSGVGLGHRRLSVIDLSQAGRQPMASHNGRVHIVYNGEIYNFQEIRKILEVAGHRFQTQTDTEVILAAYTEWGVHCLERFVGMFAFAIWDKTTHTLFMARDRIGIKPLYYHHRAGRFTFASELKALMAFEHFPKAVDPDALALYLHYQYVPAPRTIFQNTWKLLPGQYLLYDGQNPTFHTYWSMPGRGGGDAQKNEYESVEKLEKVLGEAVSCRRISDVPLGALLSGGIDSSIVAALMQNASQRPVRTFSIGFKETGYDEAPWASKVAMHLGTDHTEMYVTPQDALNLIPHLPVVYNEPFADSSAIPTCLVSRLARSHVTVALSGDGGDEQFAGYVRYWSTRAMVDVFQRLPKNPRKALGILLESVPPSWVEKWYRPWRDLLPQRFRVMNFVDKWQKLIGLMRRMRLEELYRMTICLWPEQDIRAVYGRDIAPTRYEETFSETEAWPILSRLMRVDQKTYLPDALLTKVDRASMAYSLEVRVPLLDHRVLEFTAEIPENLKYKDGKGKYLLRRLLSRYVPKSLFERPKMGFGVPIDTWFRGELKPLLLDYLSAERIKREGLFDPELVEITIKEHLSNKSNHQYRLWALLMWEMWREHWLN